MLSGVPVSSSVLSPSTTIRQPLEEMGAAAAEMMLAIGRGEPPRFTRLELTTELVIRQSTAPPRG